MSKEQLSGFASRTNTPDINSSDVNMAFDSEARQAQQDWNDYLKGRDWVDGNGSVHEARTNKFKSTNNENDNNNAHYDEIVRSADDSRDSVGLVTLARQAAEARLRGDKTVLIDLEDEIQDRLAHHAEEFGWDNERTMQRLDTINNIIYGQEQASETDPVSEPELSGVFLSDESDSDEALTSGPEIDSAGVGDDNQVSSPDDKIEPIDLDDDSEELSPVYKIEPIDLDDDEIQDESDLDKSSKDINWLREAWIGEFSVDNPKYENLVKEFNQSRHEFLEVMARSQKGHLRSLDPGGWTAQLLYKLKGGKLVDLINKPTKEEQTVSDAYKKALSDMSLARADFIEKRAGELNLSDDDILAEKAGFIAEHYAQNTLNIVDLQKSTAKRPLNKWLRRAGYGAAGIVGGLLALTPLGWVGGAAVAGAGAAGLRVLANKRNANIEGTDGEKKVDQVAEAMRFKFNNSINRQDDDEITTDLIVKGHISDSRNEIEKNRKRVLWPVMGAIGVAVATRFGLGNMLTPNPDTPPNPGTAPNPGTPPNPGTAPNPDTPPNPDNVPGLPTEAYVERGSGEIRETRQLLEQVLGRPVSLSDAEKAYHAVGGDIFANDTNYLGRAGDVRIGAPGTYQFKEGVVQKILDAFNNINQ